MLGSGIRNQPVKSENLGLLEEYYDVAYDQLKEDELAIFPSTGPVPNRIVTHFISMIAMQGTEEFGVSDQRFQRIAAKNNIALREIMKHVSKTQEEYPEYTDY